MVHVLVGWLCAAIAVLFFGSNFAVVAKYDAGDGMFFQFALCIGIWIVGLIVFIIRDAPPFYTFACVGGIIWCTGNCCTVFIIQQIGLGPGLVTWGTTAMVIGWLTGFFGLFGIPSEREDLRSPGLNVVGLGLSLLALLDSTFIKKGATVPNSARDVGNLTSPETTPQSREIFPLALGRSEDEGGGQEHGQEAAVEVEAAQSSDQDPSSMRYLGIAAALLAGCCYGSNFLPSTWIQKHTKGASQDGLDYVFNQFCGILLTSTVYLATYCCIKRNRRFVNKQIFLPAVLSGMMWGIAQSCWFVANATLGYSAAFPIVLIGPGFIGSLWSIFFFKDIYGRRNYLLLAGYFCLAAAACTCIVLSRKTDDDLS
mmetsp:Transcript_63845/g.134455  ORF Transcript_63845/g.134455 Transcript_63845/m.134455 type:complete len:369 (+) Transcript_63845:29-1135(+)